MSQHAKKMVEKLYKKLESNNMNVSERITVRLEDEYYLMLKEMSESFKFSIPQTLSELIELNLIELISLLEEDLRRDFSNNFKSIDGGILEKLRERHLIEEQEIFL